MADQTWEWDETNATRMGKYITEMELRFIFNNLKGKITSSILDIGAGSGRITTQAMERGYHNIIGLEMGMLQLQKFKINTNNSVPVILADAIAIPFEDQSFDVLLALQIVNNLPDIGKFLSECYRILRPGGFLLFNCSNRSSPYSLLYKTIRKNKSFYRLSSSEVKKMAENAGFRPEKIYGFRWIPFSRDSNSILIPVLSKIEIRARSIIPSRISPWIFFILKK